jgi:fluoroacetyl-CoA thioesterase
VTLTIKPGLEASVERTVNHADTATALGSGDVEVLGTPAVVALCELAAVHAVTGALGPNETTVGVRIDLDHLAPTLPGHHVIARARLTNVDGRTLGFDVEAQDPYGPIARGRHVRVVVDREQFLNSARERA